MLLNDCLAKLPEGRNFKRRSSDRWLKVYQDGTIRAATAGRGPKKVEPLTTSDISATDWHYEHTKVLVSREDLMDAARIACKENLGAAKVAPVEFAKLLADQLNMD